MARGKKVVYKKAAGRKKKTYVEESDDDESYVAEDESTSESDAHNEESFDASETSDSASLVAGEDEDEDDDEEEEEEDEEETIPTAKQKSHRGYSSGRRRPRVSDCDWEEDDYEDDEDFSPDANEKEVLEEESLFLGDIRYSSRRATKKGERKLKRKTMKPKANRRSSKVTVAPSRGKRRRVVTSSDDEDNFLVKNRSAVKNCRKDSRKVNKRAVKSIASRKKMPSIDSDSFDSDFLTSDDDLSVKVGVVVNGTKNKKRTKPEKRRKVLKMDSETSDSDFVVSDEGLLDNEIVGLGRRRKNRNERKSVRTSKKHMSVESECTDSNDSASEDDMNGLEIERTLNLRKHKGSEGVKGKEKEGGDLVKQSCGICLSEERKGTIQGILNCCPHYYCFSCIIEWSKVETRCPFCKRRFATITKSSKSDPRRSVIRVQMRDQVYQPSEEELRVLLDPYEDVVCMECHQGGDDSLMLLCDICDSSAHTYCVGLGSEVPDGNWYCECCRLAADGGAAGPSGSSSNRTTQSQGAEGNGPIFRWSVPSQGQPSSQPFDLNAPPDVVPVSPASGTGALTLSGRRAIQQRIRILLSNSRARQPLAVGVGPSIVTTPSQRTNAISPFEQEQVQSSGGDFRQVEGAKKQVQSLVKSCLKRLCRESSLERTAFKKIARKATHTILALCGIHHRTSFVSPSCLQPPARCHHDLDSGPVNLVRGCCSSCFTDYVKHVVKFLAEAS